MALTPEKKRKIILYSFVSGVIFGGFCLIIWGGTKRGQVAWDNPQYHRDPRAPKICMCYWMRSAFRVPCEDVPPELLLEK